MGVTKSDLVGSLFIAAFLTGILGVIYNLNAATGWPILTGIGLVSFFFSAYILQNQQKNQRKWEKRPVTFPNPEGGGILGQYIERPWQNELAQIGRRYGRKAKKNRSKTTES